MSKNTTRKSIWGDTPASTEGTSAPGNPWGEAPFQPPQATSVVEQLRVAEVKERSRNWEKRTVNKPATFRGVPPKLHQALKDIAADLQVSVDDVARAFLEFGWQCCQRGEITLQPRLSNQRLTLFPQGDSWGGAQKPGWVERVWGTHPPEKTKASSRKRKSEDDEVKSWRWPKVSYRGLPEELRQAIHQLHEQYHVPVGEVVTLFLGHALEAYESGRLALTPQPRSGSTLTYAEVQ